MLDISALRSSLTWHDNGTARTALWLTADGHRPPTRVALADDDLSADSALRAAADGAGLLWRGDFHNARHLLDAMKRRLTRTGRRRPLSAAGEFRRLRQDRAHMSRQLSTILVEVSADLVLDLPRAPVIAAAFHDVFGPDVAGTAPAVMSLRELLGILGAHRWRQRGIEIPALDGRRIHPHHGVFAPTRRDYVDLVARTPLRPTATAFDVGTGTGVLAALLLHRGVPAVVATDVGRRAVECAMDNLERLGYSDRSTVEHRDLCPAGRADLVVCNPPWVPATPSSPLEAGVFDRGSAVLTRFVRQLPDHLTDDGEAWLVLSDLPERLGLRDEAMLPELIGSAGLTVLDRSSTPPTTSRRTPTDDPLTAYRNQERIHLWRLARL